MYRLEGWRTHREINYTAKWEEYYRLWRGIWDASDRLRNSERSRIIAPALQQAVESSVAELEEATFGRGKWFDLQDDMLDNDKSEALSFVFWIVKYLSKGSFGKSGYRIYPHSVSA